MIGVGEISLAANGGKAGGYRLRSVVDSMDATDGRQASCQAWAQVLSQQAHSRLAESAGAYGLRERLNLPDVEDEGDWERDISELGIWITYLENKYDLKR